MSLSTRQARQRNHHPTDACFSQDICPMMCAEPLPQGAPILNVGAEHEQRQTHAALDTTTATGVAGASQ
jgi:hypothetical protein